MQPTDSQNYFSYKIPKKDIAPAGQVYLGTFLAFALFFSFFFGNLLFFLIVLIISIFIFLEREVDIADTEGNIEVIFFDDGFIYGKKEYKYPDISNFTIYHELFGETETHVRFAFKRGAVQDLYIFVPQDVPIKHVYDIIRQHVRENKDKEMSLTDGIVLRFF